MDVFALCDDLQQVVIQIVSRSKLALFGLMPCVCALNIVSPMQRSTAYASEDKIHFNFFFAVKIVRHVQLCILCFVFVFAVALCVLFMVCCSWLILCLWTMENYDSARLAPIIIIIIIINFHVCLRKHTYLFHAMLTPSHRRWTIGHITASHDSFSMSILIGQWLPPSSSPAARATAATATTATAIASIALILRCISDDFNFCGSVWIVARTTEQIKTTTTKKNPNREK